MKKRRKSKIHSINTVKILKGIGSDVTRSKPERAVIIESGNITFDATNTVIIKNGFECKKGAILEIK